MISELTEIRELEQSLPLQGWIFYDRDCRSCRGLARRFGRVFRSRGFEFEPLQEAWVQQRLDVTPAQALEEMRVLTRDGRIFAGADAVIFLARQIWWAAPLDLVARISWVRAALHRIYGWVAANRTCVLPKARDRDRSLLWTTRWLGLALLPLLALGTKPLLPAWGFMWTMAFALFFGCKWLTLAIASRDSDSIRAWRAAAYLFATPGMDAALFLARLQRPRGWGRLITSAGLALLRIVLGLSLLFVVARHTAEPLLAGWIAMIGMVLLLHFGLFSLVTALWQTFGVNARPVMNAPLRSTSVGEFWGRRWNAAFNDLTLRLIFRPMARRTGSTVATLLAFFVSGVVHELVISRRRRLRASVSLFSLPRPCCSGRAQSIRKTVQSRGWQSRLVVHHGRCSGSRVLAVSPDFRPASGFAVHAGDGGFMKSLLQLAGILHFVILIASALTPRVLDWRTNLSPLNPFLRRLFWVYGGFIVLTILSFGTITLVHAETLASATPLARAVCAMIAIFWGARLAVQFFVFDAEPFLTTSLLRVGYHGLSLIFATLVAIYGWAAFNPSFL
jgi:predicted DCC family thiol-disulfide oxidoreductase YuxK